MRHKRRLAPRSRYWVTCAGICLNCCKRRREFLDQSTDCFRCCNSSCGKVKHNLTYSLEDADLANARCTNKLLFEEWFCVYSKFGIVSHRNMCVANGRSFIAWLDFWPRVAQAADVWP